MQTSTEEGERDFGSQPLDGMMMEYGLENHDLVDVSLEQLTHKQVQRARKGRQLTLKMMQKVTRAYNVALFNKLPKQLKEDFLEYTHKHLFNYAKGYEATAPDINAELLAEWKQ